jgi:hypothetical protein
LVPVFVGQYSDIYKELFQIIEKEKASKIIINIRHYVTL